MHLLNEVCLLREALRAGWLTKTDHGELIPLDVNVASSILDISIMVKQDWASHKFQSCINMFLALVINKSDVILINHRII